MENNSKQANICSKSKPKPILTYAGDVGLFTSLSPSIVQALPNESTEWRRSYGRVTKSVQVEASFVPFSAEILPRDGDWQIIKQPIFHIYWTECLDVEVYKNTVREDIETWLKTLSKHNNQDWLIVLVETYDIRKSNKLLPRTTVIDKIRSDFAAKQVDRCISVINPVRSESRSAESWRGLLSRIRLLVLTAYNTTLLRFEEAIRDQRERRNETGWCFCQYFLLQEEMAFVLEMLGVYDEALVQYDELDALFTQFVLNCNAGESASWLSTFQSPMDSWSGLSLNTTVNQDKRELIGECKTSLLEFRCYLFSRQCAMLLLTMKPWEIAQRSLPFLHNCCNELAILEISCTEGGLACWVFLCCLEVLYTCQRFSESDQVEAYSLYTASLWAYARDKLRELGELCGLTPGRQQPTSEQLHTVVGLSAGMGDPEATDHDLPTPTDKLRESLSSKAAFKRQYLELAELAMGTYKHIGRLRSARLVGRDLAAFYVQAAETHKATAFLADALRTFEDEGWARLAAQTRLQLAACYRSMQDRERFVKTACVIASSVDMPESLRRSFQDEMMSTLENIAPETPLETSLEDCFHLESVTVDPGGAAVIIKDSEVLVLVRLRCHFLVSVPCTEVILGLERGTAKKQPVEDVSLKKLANGGIGPLLCMVEHFDRREDKSLSSASIIARNPREFLQRKDSSNRYLRPIPVRLGCEAACKAEGVLLQPGDNEISLKYTASETGMFTASQVSIVVANRLIFLSSLCEQPWPIFKVSSESSSVELNKADDRDLLTGLPQDMVLTVKTGSSPLNQECKLDLQCSRGLKMQLKSCTTEPMSKQLSIELAESEPFSTTSVVLRVMAELPPQKDSHSVEHKVTLTCPWTKEARVIPLHFQPPLMSTFRLHTARARKFAQVVVVGLSRRELSLCLPELTCREEKVDLTPLNPCAGQPLVVSEGTNVSFLWQLDVSQLDGTTPVKLMFAVNYAPAKLDQNDDKTEYLENDNLGTTNDKIEKFEQTDPLNDQSERDDMERTYRCVFDVTNYKTLFVVGTSVEPTKGSGEFCRASSMCHLVLTVEGLIESPHNSLMYEVLADQAMWAVCGRTAGVISLDSLEKQTVTLDVMPLIGGFLPLPLVRLSKYIPAVEQKPSQGKEGTPRRVESHPRLEPFSPGQVFNSSKSQQVHVLPSVTPATHQDNSLN